MFKFIYYGIIRDINRSLLPIIVVTLGVFFYNFFKWLDSGRFIRYDRKSMPISQTGMKK